MRWLNDFGALFYFLTLANAAHVFHTSLELFVFSVMKGTA